MTSTSTSYGWFLNLLGGRKFIMTLLILIVTTWLAHDKILKSDDFANIVKWILFIYVAGNVGHVATSAIQEFVKRKFSNNSTDNVSSS